jgi:steroid 5-alpha reductase family enzyme
VLIMPGLIVAVAVFLALAMAGAWQVQRATGNSGWVDVIWSFATGIAGLVFALSAQAVWWRQCLVAALVVAWAARLALHIAGRSFHASDDPRYAFLRQEWGDAFQSRLFLFLQIQAASAFVLAISVLLAARNPAPALRVQDVLAALVLIVGIAGEALADNQLRRFRADPANRGRICDSGLWAWSRHPNYFFEWLGWIAYPVFAIDLAGGAPWGWLALAGPAFMYWLLVHASGIPPLEAHMLRSRGDAFRAYQSRTNAFFPGPPKP